jgi:hypothetical protein
LVVGREGKRDVVGVVAIVLQQRVEGDVGMVQSVWVGKKERENAPYAPVASDL